MDDLLAVATLILKTASLQGEAQRRAVAQVAELSESLSVVVLSNMELFCGGHQFVPEWPCPPGRLAMQNETKVDVAAACCA